MVDSLDVYQKMLNVEEFLYDIKDSDVLSSKVGKTIEIFAKRWSDLILTYEKENKSKFS